MSAGCYGFNAGQDSSCPALCPAGQYSTGCYANGCSAINAGNIVYLIFNVIYHMRCNDITRRKVVMAGRGRVVRVQRAAPMVNTQELAGEAVCASTGAAMEQVCLIDAFQALFYFKVGHKEFKH